MAKESYKDLPQEFEDFDTSLLYDDIERIREIEEAEEKDQNTKLSFAGLMALIAGVVLMAITIGGTLFPPNMVEFLRGFMQIAGFGALFYGFIKMLQLVIRQKELNFPALNVYRKTKPVSKTKTTRQEKQRASQEDQTRSYQRRPSSYAQNTRKELRRSRKNRVFSGVAGGLAEYFKVSSSLLRFAFILSIFATSGSSIILYLLLSIVLPPNYEEYGSKGSSRRGTPRDEYVN